MKTAMYFPYEFSDVFAALSNEDAGILIKAILNYEINKTEPELNGVLQFAWNSHIKPKLDRIAENYAAKCAKNRENVSKRWQKDDTVVYERIRPNTTVRHKYGTYENVLLTDEQMEKLKNEFPNDYAERIDRVSEYCKSTGKSYKDYLATIRNWARREAQKPAKIIPVKNDVNAGYNQALSILGIKNG